MSGAVIPGDRGLVNGHSISTDTVVSTARARKNVDFQLFDALLLPSTRIDKTRDSELRWGGSFMVFSSNSVKKKIFEI